MSIVPREVVDKFRADFIASGEKGNWGEYNANRAAEWALEQAARICDLQAKEPECPERAAYCAEAIRALILTKLKGGESDGK